MPFELPANLHPDCARVAWLLGTWAGNGEGGFPGSEPFHFGQELIFTHDGRSFFHYLSRSWLVDAHGARLEESDVESGFLRPRADGAVELLLAHSGGVLELYYGQAEGSRLELTTDAVVRSETAEDRTAAQRMYGLVEGDLWFAYDRATTDQALQADRWGKLLRR